MWSTPDMAEVISHVASAGAKLILAGDLGQLQAVESGGMTLLANTLGYAQLREPVRFAEPFLFGINQQGRTGHPRGRQRIDKRRAEVFGGIGTCRRINTLLT